MQYLRKTRWTSEITPELDGEEVVVAGWVWEVRDLGRIKFVILRDRDGFVQIAVKRGQVSDEMLNVVKSLGKEDVIAVRGVVRASKIARAGVEIVPQEIQILNRAKPLPIDIWGNANTDLATRLRYRAVDLKRPENLALFKISSVVTKMIREVFYRNNFIEVFTPKIISTCTEGGADLFAVQYFDRVAYLAQSPQLYKEQLTASLERVFEIAPAFRAEKHDTNYHLNEFVSVDAEAAFMDYMDVMNVLDEVIVECYSAVRSKCKRELEVLNVEIDVPRRPIRKITYDEALEILREHKIDVPWGEDIPQHGLKVLSSEVKEPFYIIDWPAKIRPFYSQPKPGDERYTESFDLIIDGIEVASGSTRIHDAELLEKSMREHGLNVDEFRDHLQVFNYGMPPHAGFGLGLYRLLMAMLKRRDIREVALYPRDRYRLRP